MSAPVKEPDGGRECSSLSALDEEVTRKTCKVADRRFLTQEQQ